MSYLSLHYTNKENDSVLLSPSSLHRQPGNDDILPLCFYFKLTGSQILLLTQRGFLYPASPDTRQLIVRFRVHGLGSIIHEMRYYSYEDIDIFLTQCPVCSIVNDVCDDLLPLLPLTEK